MKTEKGKKEMLNLKKLKKITINLLDKHYWFERENNSNYNPLNHNRKDNTVNIVEHHYDHYSVSKNNRYFRSG